jgi:UDP-2,3-diacylglucosamine pyrophosphatase LpxH
VETRCSERLYPGLGKIAELKDSGIDIYFFVGNHDLWMKNYFEEELGVPVFFEKRYYEVNGKKLLLAHGDGLGPGDKGYKRMKKSLLILLLNGHFAGFTLILR